MTHASLDEARAAMARLIYRQRQLRRLHFAGDLFDESAWEALLFLYVLDPDGAPLSREILCERMEGGSHVVGRWLSHLEADGLVVADAAGGATLSEDARRRLDRFLDEAIDAAAATR